MLFILVGYLYFALPAVTEVVVVSLVDRLIIFHYFETAGSMFILNDADGIDWGYRWYVQRILISLNTDDVRRRWARYSIALMLANFMKEFNVLATMT